MAAAIPPKVSKMFDIFVSIAAAVVIYGALQKILHTPMADIMLKIGLTTEAVIFLGYGVLYVIYPAIDDHEVHLPGKTAAPAGNPALASLDKMLDEANINQDSLAKLSAGFQKLNTTVTQIADISNVVKSTSDFSTKASEASAALAGIKDAAAHATQSLSGFSGVSESAKQFHEQMQSMNKNLSSLNTIYELEIQEGNKNLKSFNEFYGKLSQASAAMASSADDAVKAKEQMGALATNLGKLNNLYGNMITAMQGR
ncbi:gliding motility protein GldL [Sediminibacterium roseum]|uniref:Gliding motility protein GldL n=2 Tax=Sediminibacterium roseum TaxID=1978412 RepID=A0ABW9ZNZ8_9BACT|nr:gliding motility protein GldL [Sediminibacterium roseum]